MTERERMLAVYRGETPDQVPLFLDLSHWWLHRHRLPYDLSETALHPDPGLVAYHKEVGVGFYFPNPVSCYDVAFPPDVSSTVSKGATPEGRPALTWRIETPLGVIQRTRYWEEQSWSWTILEWGVSSERDVRVLAYALGRRRYVTAFDRYDAWLRALGGIGVPYASAGVSGIGHLLSYWMGLERVVYASMDMPAVLHEAVDQINANALDCVDALCRGPAEVVAVIDNLTGDIHSPGFFKTWSAPYYREMCRRVRAAGKYSAVHLDGRLKGLLRALAEVGACCVDSVTPAPMFDLTPQECRDEAGPGMILCGGVPPCVWMPQAADQDFRKAVLDWLAIRTRSPRLIAAGGDQVPPGAPEHRIRMMRELVDRHGRY